MSVATRTRRAWAAPIRRATPRQWRARSIPASRPPRRPQAVVLVDEHDWPGSLAASVARERAAPRAAALRRRRHPARREPPGAAGDASDRRGRAGRCPGDPDRDLGRRARGLSDAHRDSRRGDPAAVAAAIERLSRAPAAARPRQVIVLAADAPLALQMPAAGLAAESGAPILFVNAGTVPAATAAALTRLRRPAIYVIGPSAVGARALGGARAASGTSRPIRRRLDGRPKRRSRARSRTRSPWRASPTAASAGESKNPATASCSRTPARPLDAPAGAPLSASGDYAPLLLLESSAAVPPALARYLSDIQPAYGSAPQYQPVHGAYNHGWLIGDERAISAGHAGRNRLHARDLPAPASLSRRSRRRRTAE